MSANNLLILMSDEHTRSVFGAYGNPLARTPALDRLASEGVRFEQAYTPSPICISARASFATGLPVFEHGCWSSAEAWHGEPRGWMHRLRERGHEVVSIGKLHYRSAADDLGFSESLLPMYLANDGRGWPQALQRRPLGKFPEAAEMAAHLGPGESDYTRYDRRIAAAAVDWLSARPRANNPWVLFVSFVSPHFPLTAPREYYDLYREVEMPRPFDCDPPVDLRHPVIDAMRGFWNYADYFDRDSEIEALRNYYGLCSFLDANIGRVLAALDAAGLSANTQVVYTSDHGDQIGNHGIWGKCFMYEDSVAIPMLLRGPGITPGINPTPVTLADIAPTATAAVGAAPRAPAQAWRGRPLQCFVDQPEPGRAVLSEYHDGGSPCGVTMLRQDNWKYIYFADGHAPLLFDLRADPRETRNLADDPAYASPVAGMREQLHRILDPEVVNRRAFEDQARMIESYGGIDALRALPSFNHTPLENV